MVLVHGSPELKKIFLSQSIDWRRAKSHGTAFAHFKSPCGVHGNLSAHWHHAQRACKLGKRRRLVPLFPLFVDICDLDQKRTMRALANL
mmetsp:Transcript_21102/g.37007  ORF Transcript_21102/g.37007 Transcript_21102/m.37007 type:complete len:89 (+) Transcript_21102:995-1261(+)